MRAQIKASIDNSKDQWEFWQRTSLNKGACGLLGKTTSEASNLASYFEGRFDMACDMRASYTKSLTIDIEFLIGMKSRLEDGDVEYLQEMVDDWLGELKRNLG